MIKVPTVPSASYRSLVRARGGINLFNFQDDSPTDDRRHTLTHDEAKEVYDEMAQYAMDSDSACKAWGAGGGAGHIKSN